MDVILVFELHPSQNFVTYTQTDIYQNKIKGQFDIHNGPTCATRLKT